jgi:hypothetical protein
MALLEYMALMDSEDPTQALGQLDPQINFLLALPGNAVRGSSREDFANYIAGRRPNKRVHHVIKHHLDGDVEFVYGVVTEQGVTTGAFLSAARLSPDGKIIRYHSSFDTDLVVTDLP